MKALVRIGIVDEDVWDPSDKVPLIGDCMDAARRDWIDLVVLNDAPLVLQFEAVRPNEILYAADDFEPGGSHRRFCGCTGTFNLISDGNARRINDDS